MSLTVGMESNSGNEDVMADLDHSEDNEDESVKEFQKFMYDLFDKNGVLCDLRAYLRGHIVDVLRSAQIGNLQKCQKRFTEMIDLKFQAINILIVEYLMRQEFNYSLSVFVSEIPIKNMVFRLSKTLLQNKFDTENDLLRFEECDIWAILNYLGVPCDSEYATNILTLYESDEKLSLLQCILKCAHSQNTPYIEQEDASPSLSSSIHSSNSSIEACEHVQKEKTVVHNRCRHYVVCRACQSRTREKKKKFKKSTKIDNPNVVDLEDLMKNMNILERNLVDEMFDQVKSVYETELEMVRDVERKKIKKSIASYAQDLQKERDSMQDQIKARESELEMSLQEKKKFLWGLAKSLRDQHKHMAKAMKAVREEGKRLTRKEESLKRQVLEAEEILKKKGEELRVQISNELFILETHVHSMKNERESITTERTELERLKQNVERNDKIQDDINIQRENSCHYELLEKELMLLKKYIEATRLGPKCVIERGTLTELHDITSRIDVVLNNEHKDMSSNNQEITRFIKDNVAEGKRSNQLVNDLKKPKVVNFSVDTNFQSSNASRSSFSQDGTSSVDGMRNTMQRLQEENMQLRCFSSQQRLHIDELSTHRARLQAELTLAKSTIDTLSINQRPNVPEPFYVTVQRASTSAQATAVSQRKGAGEQLSVFTNANPHVIVPGDAVPFVGRIGGRQDTDGRRNLGKQWRVLKKVTIDAAAKETQRVSSETNDTGSNNSITRQTRENSDSQYKGKRVNEYLSTAKAMKLKNNSLRSQTTSYSKMEDGQKSPTVMLREARVKLRKLEIEAEAVERSYLEFRKKQSDRKLERNIFIGDIADDASLEPKYFCRKTDTAPSPPKTNTNKKVEENAGNSGNVKQNEEMSDFDKYLKDYKGKLDIGKTYYKNKTSALTMVKPIPAFCSEPKRNLDSPKVRFNNDLIETPMMEFRNYYYCKEDRQQKNNINTDRKNRKDECLSPILSHEPFCRKTEKTNQNIKNKVQKRKEAELEILRNNINKIYNLDKHSEGQEHLEITEIEKLDIKDIKAEDVILVSKTDDLIKKDSFSVEAKEIITTANTDTKTPKESNNNLLVVVESSIERLNIPSKVGSDHNDPMEMTIIISPRSVAEEMSLVKNHSANTKSGNESIDDSLKSIEYDKASPILEARSTRTEVLESIFNQNSEGKLVEITKDNDDLETYRVSDPTNVDEFDNFSADVDNYNSRSDYENISPISLMKTPEDDNFWDS